MSVATDFGLVSDSGKMTLLATGSDMVRYRHSNDGGWTDGSGLLTPVLVHHDARTVIEQRHGHLEVNFHTFADEYDIDVHPGCRMTQSSGPEFYVQADESLDVHAVVSGTLHGAWWLSLVILDLPIEPPGTTRCYTP
jgi:hypothetical protein